MAEMLDALHNFYEEEGIAAEAFNCPRAPSCRGVCKGELVTAREAFVGSEYEKGTLPRVLFVSLDPAKDLSGGDPDKRTLKYMRYWEEDKPDGCKSTLKKGTHWGRTHTFAYDLLRPRAIKKRISSFRSGDIHRYFAHTNSAKCKDGGETTKQGHPRMFKNCRPFISPEVKLLRPDVLVTQGEIARQAIDGQFKVVRDVPWPEYTKYDSDLHWTLRYQVLRIDNREVLYFSLFHPGYYNRLPKKYGIEPIEDVHPWYFDVAQDFFEGV